MKTLSFLVLFFTSFSAVAFTSNPLIRICNITGGLFHVVAMEDDQVGFCVYGSAMLDSLSILEVTSDNVTTMAVEALEDSTAESCSEAHGVDVKGQDLEGKDFDLCSFEDGSVIELETLKAGSEAAENSQLMKAIQTRF